MLVIDASVALTWCFTDEATPATDAILERAASEGAVVPAHFHLELGNVLVQAERRGRISVAYSAERLGVIRALAISVDPQSTRRAWGETLSLARGEKLSVYDAAYLELAIRTGSTLATLDRELIAAARQQGVDILP